MTTPRDIILLAMKQCGALGVGQTARAEDVNDAFTYLNAMIAQWRRKRWLVYHLLDLSLVSTGASSYTIGPTGDFVMSVRPAKIEAAYVRQLITTAPNQIDYPLEILQAREDYNLIGLKQLTSFPAYLFYDSAWPLGVLYPWPLPQATIYELHLNVKAEMSAFDNLSATIDLPPEYEAALIFNLAIRLGTMFKLPSDPAVVGLAEDALNVIRESNTQIAALTMPPGLAASGTYNPYSDRTN